MTSPRTEEAARVLIETTRLLADARTIKVVAAIVERAIRSLVAADGATFVLRDGDNCWYLDEDAVSPLWKGRRFPMSACISGWAMLFRQQVVIPDIAADMRIPQDAYRPTFVRSLVMTPVRSRDCWAAIGAYWAKKRTPEPQETAWLQVLADGAAVALENVRIAGKLREQGFVDEPEALALPGGEAPPGEVAQMCAWSRRIKLDGKWITVEEYLQRRFGVVVTHGISEEALRVLRTEIGG